MTRNVKKLSQEDYSKIVEEFLKKSISIILQSRVSSDELVKQNVRNVNFFTIDNFTYDIGKLLNDEYRDLKVFNEIQQFHVIIDIYYNHDKIKLLCEKFSLKINLKKPKEEEYIRKRVIKKLSSLVRSFYSVVRVLPSYYFFQNKKFGFFLDYKLYYNSTMDENFVKNTQKMKLNLDSDIGVIKFKVKYYLKNDIFYLEKELDSKNIEEKNANFIKRSRLLSENIYNKCGEEKEEEKKEEKKNNKTKSNNFIDSYFENTLQRNRISSNLSNTKIEPTTTKNYNKQGDYISINSYSNSDDNQIEKNKSSDKFYCIKKEMNMLSTYLLPTELNMEKTSSSETSSLDSYELEFESNTEDKRDNDHEFSHREEEFKLEEMVSKIKNLKKMMKNKTYNPLVINYKSIVNIIDR